MKIATFNANSIRSRIDIILNWLDKHQPDVLCIQETKCQDKDFPGEVFDDTDYEFVFKGQKAYNGVAIFSKFPIEECDFGLDSEPVDESRIISVKINNINIINTYIPQGNDRDSEKFQYKLEWFKRFKQYLTNKFKPTNNVIWLGDLNVAPEAIDVHSPERLEGHVCFCSEVWDAFADVKEWGFTDILREKHPDETIYTFWDYRSRTAFENDRGWRIDHILVTPSLVNKCSKVYVDREPRGMEKPSDHTFLVAEFDL